MSNKQLPLPLVEFREWELTPFDRELYGAIHAAADPATGAARSLFSIVAGVGLSYWYSLDRLEWLEQLGYVKVQRPGRAKPLVIWPCWGGFRGH